MAFANAYRCSRFGRRVAGHPRLIEQNAHQQIAMLRILYGACSTALDAFRAADNRIDEQLVVDLETMVTRTHGEIERLTLKGG